LAARVGWSHSDLSALEQKMNLFTIIGVVVVALFVVSYLGLH
jgi:hypothetical protein